MASLQHINMNNTAFSPADEEDDDDYDCPMGHIMDHKGAPTVKKRKTGIKHLQVFLTKHGGKYNALGISASTDAGELSYKQVSNEDFVGQYLNYLARHATWLNDPNKLLSLASAVGMASAFAEYYIDKYRNHPIPPSLVKDKWSKRLALITTIKVEHHYKTGTPLVEEKETATEADRISLAIVCMMAGTADAAEMLHMMNTSTQHAGRGSDIATSKLLDIRTEAKTDSFATHRYLLQNVNRHKTQTVGKHRIFPHRCHMELDYYFSLALLLVLRDYDYDVNDTSVTLFPHFAPKMFNKQGNVESNVSSAFNAWLDFYWQMMFAYINGGLC
jgi:hypothetical protein